MEELWNEAGCLKQSKQSKEKNAEEIINCARNLCFQGQYGRAAKVLASDDFAPFNKATINSLKKWPPTEEKPIVIQIVSSQAYQISKENFSEHLNLFSRFTAAGPSKKFQEHLLHAVLTKVVKKSYRGELPEFVSQALCSASLSALLKRKGGIRSIAVAEILRKLIAK